MESRNQDGPRKEKEHVQLDEDQKHEIVRQYLKMTQTELAARFNVTRRTIYNVLQEELERCRYTNTGA